MPALSLARLAPQPDGDDPPRPLGCPVAPQDAALLNYLRDLARHAQLAAPMTLDQQCGLVQPATRDAYGAALMRTLNVVATRALVFHPRGANEAGFDEMWLLRLLRCIQIGDTDSACLLIAGRTNRIGRRTVTWLAHGLAERLDPPGLE